MASSKQPSRRMSVPEVLAWLRRRGSRRNVLGMARYGITARRAFGVSMATMAPLAGRLRPDHDLARALWRSGWHEARILAALIDDPGQLTVTQMNDWARAFDNWAVCDTTCLHLFDRSPLAWRRCHVWASSRHEFVVRAAFALMAALAVHDTRADDARFLAMLPVIERVAEDDRNFVKKAVNWALRAIGRRSPALRAASLAVARRLAVSSDPAPRWVGRDARRALTAARR